jgi:choline dehydrogenase
MLYLRGNAKDYDEWADLGADGWSYQDILPFFKKSQQIQDSPDVDSEFHGTDGPMHVRKIPKFYHKSQELIESSLVDILGLPIGDPNGKNQNVVFRGQFNQNNGKRADSYTSFAVPYAGKNLKVLTHAIATKIVMEGVEAKGVQIERLGQTLEYYAKNEVILSAGAIGSPQILMLSGISPWEHLQKIGVEKLVLNKPGVGSNLQDHVRTHFELFPESSNMKRWGADPFLTTNPLNYWTYFTNPRPFNGPLSDSLISSGAFAKTPSNNDVYNRPNIQFHSSPFITKTIDYGISNKLGTMKLNIWSIVHIVIRRCFGKRSR